MSDRLASSTSARDCAARVCAFPPTCITLCESSTLTMSAAIVLVVGKLLLALCGLSVICKEVIFSNNTCIFNTVPYPAANAVECYDTPDCSGDFRYADSPKECCISTDTSSSFRNLTDGITCTKCIGKLLLFEVVNKLLVLNSLIFLTV